MAKKAGLILGIVFLLVGLLGFIGNPIVGGDGALFHTDTMHNIVHLVTGVLFILVALAASHAVSGVLKVFGIVYLLVAAVGFFAVNEEGMGTVLGLFEVNGADNWLHVVLGVLLLWVGVKAGKGREAMGGSPSMSATPAGMSGGMNNNSGMGGGNSSGMTGGEHN